MMLLTEHDIKVATNIIDVISEPFNISNEKIKIGVSIGIALYPNNGDSLGNLLRKADEAMYQAKLNGKNSWKMTS